MPIPFSAEPKLINELFGRDITYIIPEYQRPYSWQCIGKSDRNNQVNVMWDDLYNYFRHSENSSDYFFGSIVLIDKQNQVFEVIDGQQRLTTSVLLFVAIKGFLSEIRASVVDAEVIGFIEETIKFIDDVIYNKKLFGATLVEKKLKIEKNSGFEYDAIFGEVVEGKTQATPELLKGSTDEQRDVIQRYFQNREYFKGKIKSSFTNGGLFLTENAQNLNDFIEFLKNKVSVVRILAGDFNIAYHVFEILNNRGLPLSNKDLFRNFIIKEFDKLKKTNQEKYKDVDPNAKWNQLDDNYELSDDFIGRWVESTKAGQPKSSAFNDLKEIFTNNYRDKLSKNKIELFYDDIKRDLGYYTSIVENSGDDPLLRSKINFILNAPNIRYGLNFLLALSKRTDGLNPNNPLVLELIYEFERYLMYALLVGRFNYGVIYKCIGHLNANNIQLAKEAFTTEYDKSKIREGLLGDIKENEVGKLLLSKYIWIHESKTADDVVDQTLNYEKATLEHIIPQKPEALSNWVTDFSPAFREENTYRLGNMTLLTTKLNSAAKNYDFTRKKIEYTKTKLFITSEIAALPLIDETYIKNRGIAIVNAICEDIGVPII